MNLTCPKCGKRVTKMKQLEDGTILTPCCDGITELGGWPEHMSIKRAQKMQWQRDKYAQDTIQPFEMRHGEVRKGYLPNKDFLKRYKDDPGKLTKFSKSELKDSGVITESVANRAGKMAWGNNTPIKRTKIRSKKKK